MRKDWKAYKQIIAASNIQENLFLSLITEDGRIEIANANMIKAFKMKNPRQNEINFYDLLLPANIKDFKTALQNSDSGNPDTTLQLSLKNGHYHPMKWQVNRLIDGDGNKKFLCSGYKFADVRKKQVTEIDLQSIVDELGAGILFQDRNGELVAANKMAAAIFDTTLEKMHQHSDIRNLWNNTWDIRKENGEAVCFDETPFIKALQTGKFQTAEMLVHLHNGNQKWLHFNSQPLFENNNEAAYSVVTNFVDVTKERSLYRELTEREVLLKAFMKQTSNLAWVIDEYANLVYASETFFTYFGLDENEALNKKITEIVPAIIAEKFFKQHYKVMKTGVPVKFIEETILADETKFIFHINIFPIEDVPGKKLLGGHAVNFADKYEAETRLKEINHRLLLLSRASTNAIWEWDMQTGTIFRNDALMDMIGYNMDSLKGLSWWLRLIHPKDRDRVSDIVKDSTEKGLQSWEDEYQLKCADGTYKHMRDKGFIVYENGLPVKMIGSLQDVSNLKELENQLMSEKLEKQNEISESMIRAQENERTRIGHELHDNVNQILSTIKLYVDMLTPVNKEEKKIKEKSVDYIMLAVDEIRKLSKELVVPKLENNGLVSSIEGLIEDIHFTTDLAIKFAHDNENELISPAKKLTLFRIVQEQLKNILKHSKASKVDINLQSRNGTVQLIIKDNGIGFCPKQIHKGIGLSNISERTHFYNGTVDLQTSPGKGCAMEIKIPA